MIGVTAFERNHRHPGRKKVVQVVLEKPMRGPAGALGPRWPRRVLRRLAGRKWVLPAAGGSIVHKQPLKDTNDSGFGVSRLIRCREEFDHGRPRRAVRSSEPLVRFCGKHARAGRGG